MKSYTQQEIRDALAKAPQPLRDFAVSPTLLQIYDGLEKKHGLLPWQMVAISRVTTLSILGLERESALETNLHQALPLLSHTVTTELVADITTRIFKEARRRVDESILEPSIFSETPEPDPRIAEYDRINNLDDEDPEKKALLERQRAEEEADRQAFEERRRKEEEARKNAPPEEDDIPYDDSGLSDEDEEDETPIQSSYEKELEAIDKEFAEKEAAEQAAAGSPAADSAPTSASQNEIIVPSRQESPPTLQPPGPSISSTKLAAPTTSVQNEVRVASPITAVTQAPSPAVYKAEQPRATPPQGKQPDPYREAPE